jgi:thiol-disulfide isomerase/thioredoxin
MRISICAIWFLLAQSVLAQNRPGETYRRYWITPDSLYKVEPEFLPIQGAYQPAPNAVQLLRCYHEPMTVLIFFGSWCSDSKREMPRFLATLDLVKNKNFSAKLYGLDRTKKDSTGNAEAFGISHVPTFVFLRGKRDFAADGLPLTEQTRNELGRITETPIASIEQDWVNILKKNSVWAQQVEFEQQLAMLGVYMALIVASRSY